MRSLLHLQGFSLPAVILRRAIEGAAASATLVYTKIRSAIGCGAVRGRDWSCEWQQVAARTGTVGAAGTRSAGCSLIFFLWHKSPTAA